MEKLTQYLVSVALLWNQIPEKLWEPCKTSMVVFFCVKTVDSLKLSTIFAWKLSTIFAWKLSVFVRVLNKPVLIWYIRSSFWNGWEKISAHQVKLWSEICGLPVYHVTLKLL